MIHSSYSKTEDLRFPVIFISQWKLNAELWKDYWNDFPIKYGRLPHKDCRKYARDNIKFSCLHLEGQRHKVIGTWSASSKFLTQSKWCMASLNRIATDTLPCSLLHVLVSSTEVSRKHSYSWFSSSHYAPALMNKMLFWFAVN